MRSLWLAAVLGACSFSPGTASLNGDGGTGAGDGGSNGCTTDCNDNDGCTIDSQNADCSCVHTIITTSADGDGCCPSGANHATDSDCPGSCGDGHLDQGEVCDTGIASGAGACPTSCNDNNACTIDTLTDPGTCLALCSETTITQAINGDGCCPAGATHDTDTDCPVTVVPPTAYRFNTFAVRDPHLFLDVFGNCSDITDQAVNNSITRALAHDDDHDGKLDLSPTLVFRPLVQTNAAMTAADFYFADCTDAQHCTAGAATAYHVTATAQDAGTCLAPFANTTHPYSPAITNATGPCFTSSTLATVTVSLVGVPVILRDVQIAATFNGSPAGNLANGLLVGFLTQADADATRLPQSYPFIGGRPLSSLLAGGTNACPTYSDKDSDGTTTGWWFYLNFTAPTTTWTD